jgi:hypothetical protein
MELSHVRLDGMATDCDATLLRGSGASPALATRLK